MIPAVAIVAGVAVAAATISWVFDGMTEKEKRRKEELEDELSDLHDEFSKAEHQQYKKARARARAYYNRIKPKYLAEVEFFKNEKKSIKQDLDELSNSIEKELINESISPYKRESLLNNRNQIEDAKNRLNAYWLYLNWFEEKFKKMEKYNYPDDIYRIEPPQPLLPENYLYLGKLAYVQKHEIYVGESKSEGWNIYGQKLNLDDYYNKKELELYENYNQDIEFMILIVSSSKSNKYFKASIIKGELYQYILEDMSFDVQPKSNERQNQEKIPLLYKDVYLNLKRNDKLYPLKKYRENDSFEVKIKEYDILLKNVFVTEKLTNINQDISNNFVPIIFDNLEKEQIQQLQTSLEKSSFEAIKFEEKKLSLKIDTLMLEIEVSEQENILFLKNISEIDVIKLSSNLFTIPYELVLMEKEIYTQTYKEMSINKENIFLEFLLFMQEQFNYINYSTKNENKDFDFFRKWQRIIDYQIEDNSFELLELEYNSYRIEDKIVIFDVKDLKKIYSKFKDKRLRDVFVEIKGLNLGYLDDFSIEDNILKVRVDFIEDLTIEIAGTIFIKLKTYQAVLQKQKKALKDFAFSKIVNQDLKQNLITPSQITYKALASNFELYFQNENLTDNQRIIVKKAFNEKNIFLIQGPPGTGKTTIIKEMIYQVLQQNNEAKILVVSQQNVAVDNVLDGIDKENKEWFTKEGHTIIRVAPNENKIQYDNIKEFTVEKWFENYKDTVNKKFIELESLRNGLNDKLYNFSNEWMKLIYKSDFREIDNEIKELLISKHQILGATCVGLANKSLGLDLIEFDIAIIDEAGRATAPELLIPMLRAKKVILIGDHNQLPPTVDRKLRQKIEDDNEEELSPEDLDILEKSFFEELFEKTPQSNKAMLNEQFRMPKSIGDLISKLFYKNQLKNGHIKATKDFLDSKIIINWIDINGRHETEGTSSYNISEVEKVKDLLFSINEHLSKKRLKKSIGIITPYSAQKRKIRKQVKTLNLENIINIKVDTVDSFQGEEADIVIYSTVKTYGNISFLIDKKRLNVAISRTKENLFFVGKKDFFYNAKIKKHEVNLFKEIIDFI